MKYITKILLFITILLITLERPSYTKIKDIEELNNYGIKLGKEGKFKKAIEFFISAIKEEDVRAGKLYHNLGYTYELAGLKKEAIESYIEAIKRNPSQKVSYERLIILLGREKNRCKDIINYSNKYFKLIGGRKKAQKTILSIYYKARRDCKFIIIPDDRKLKNEVFISPHFRIIQYKYNNKFVKHFLTNTLPKINYDFYIWLEPTDRIAISFSSYLPPFGIYKDELLNNIEKLEVMTKLGALFLGFGIMLSHSAILEQDDIKMGFLFGLNTSLNEWKIYIYPRYIIGENSKSEGKRYDIDNFGAYYKRKDELATYKAYIDYREHFFYTLIKDYSPKLVYVGTLDIGLKARFVLKYNKKSLKKFGLSLGIGQRIYFYKESDSPFTFGDGAGYFGLSPQNIPDGNAIPGFLSNSILLNAGIFWNKYFQRGKKKKDFFMEFGINTTYEITAQDFDKNEIYISPFFRLKF